MKDKLFAIEWLSKMDKSFFNIKLCQSKCDQSLHPS